MKQWVAIVGVAAGIIAAAQAPALSANPRGSGSARLQLVEATIDDLQKAIQTGLVTIEQLTEMYLARVAAYEDAT